MLLFQRTYCELLRGILILRINLSGRSRLGCDSTTSTLLRELFGCYRGDLFDDDGFGSAALIHLAGDRDFFAGEGK